MAEDIQFKKVMDHGYVRLVDKMGSDLTIANAARVSYTKAILTFVEESFPVASVSLEENREK